MSERSRVIGEIMAAAYQRAKDRAFFRMVIEDFYRGIGMRPKRLSFKRRTS